MLIHKNISLIEKIKQYVSARAFGYSVLAGVAAFSSTNCKYEGKSTEGDALYSFLLQNNPLLNVTPIPRLNTAKSTIPTLANKPIVLVYEIGTNFDSRLVASITPTITIYSGTTLATNTVAAADISISADTTSGELTLTITNSVNPSRNYSQPNTKYNYYNYNSTSNRVQVNLSSPYLATPATADTTFNIGQPVPTLLSSSVSYGGSVNVAGTITLYFNTDSISRAADLGSVALTGMPTLRLKDQNIPLGQQAFAGYVDTAGVVAADTIRLTISNLNTVGTPTNFTAGDTNIDFEYQFNDTNLAGSVPASGTTLLRIDGVGPGATAAYASDNPIQGTTVYDPASDTIIVTFNTTGFTDGNLVTMIAGEITINAQNVAPANVTFRGSPQGAAANTLQVRIANPLLGVPTGNRFSYIQWGQSAAVNINLASQVVFSSAVQRTLYTFNSVADPRNNPVFVTSSPVTSAVPIAGATPDLFTYDFTVAGLGSVADAANMRIRFVYSNTAGTNNTYVFPTDASTSVTWTGAVFRFQFDPAAAGVANGNNNFTENLIHTGVPEFLTSGTVRPQTVAPVIWVRDGTL